MTTIDFVINQHKLNQSKFIQKTMGPLKEGQILLKTSRFAFTANNITYAVAGFNLGYWKFFPSTEKNWGIIPVWGFGEVIESNVEDITKGERFYGYFPMSSHIVMEPGKISERGFLDIISHRQSMATIYNYYTNIQADTGYSPEGESYQCLFRPLFTTSFLIDDFFAEKDFFGAKQIILTSSSSKTAYSLAFLLALRKKQEQKDISFIGLTSGRNLDFVKGLGFYDQVISYDELESQLSKETNSAIIDFTGNHNLQYQLQTHLNDQLKYNCLVGLTDWTHMQGEQKLPKKDDFFFAPTIAQQRTKEWGIAEFQKRLGGSWMLLNKNLMTWFEVNHNTGETLIQQTYQDMLVGKVNPQKGEILNF